MLTVAIRIRKVNYGGATMLTSKRMETGSFIATSGDRLYHDRPRQPAL
jgi:hypothetical protein